VLAWRLHEPVRGAHERRASGVSEKAIATEEAAPSFAEGWRLVWQIPTLRRIWWSLPFLASAGTRHQVSLARLGPESVPRNLEAGEQVHFSVPVVLPFLAELLRVWVRLLSRDNGVYLPYPTVSGEAPHLMRGWPHESARDALPEAGQSQEKPLARRCVRSPTEGPDRAFTESRLPHRRDGNRPVGTNGSPSSSFPGKGTGAEPSAFGSNAGSHARQI
jgi:hypothetical protein